jgi:hypothetical protein
LFSIHLFLGISNHGNGSMGLHLPQALPGATNIQPLQGLTNPKSYIPARPVRRVTSDIQNKSEIENPKSAIQIMA